MYEYDRCGRPHVIQTLDPAAGGPPAVVGCLAAAKAKLGHSVAVAAVKVAAAAIGSAVLGAAAVRAGPQPPRLVSRALLSFLER
jgi:hypothetical protein